MSVKGIDTLSVQDHALIVELNCYDHTLLSCKVFTALGLCYVRPYLWPSYVQLSSAHEQVCDVVTKQC